MEKKLSERGNGIPVRMRWVIWGAYVIAWTTALLTTQPVKWERLALPLWMGYPAAKSLHVSAYAVMTILTGWLRAPVRWRWLLLVLVSCHGMGTEFCQQFVPERHPAWQDVGWDHLGLALGLALSWRWWLQPSSPRLPQQKEPEEAIS